VKIKSATNSFPALPGIRPSLGRATAGGPVKAPGNAIAIEALARLQTFVVKTTTAGGGRN